MSDSNEPSSSISSNLVDRCVQLMEMDDLSEEKSKKVKTSEKETLTDISICGYNCIAYKDSHALCSIPEAVETDDISQETIESKIKELSHDEGVSLLLSLANEHPFIDWLTFLSFSFQSRSGTRGEINRKINALSYDETINLLLSLSHEYVYIEWWSLLTFRLHSRSRYL